MIATSWHASEVRVRAVCGVLCVCATATAWHVDVLAMWAQAQARIAIAQVGATLLARWL